MRLPPPSHRLAIFALLFSATVVWFHVWTRDLPDPGDADLVSTSELIPGERNALVFLGEAVERLRYPDDRDTPTDPIDLAILGLAWDEVRVAELLERNRKALDRFARARATPEFQIRVRSTDGEHRILGHWLMLTKLRALEARVIAMRETPARALDATLDLARFGARIRELDGGRMVHHLLGTSVVRVALAALQRILVDAELSPEQARGVLAEIDGLRIDPLGWARIARGDYQWNKALLDESLTARAGNPPSFSRDPFAYEVLNSMISLLPYEYTLQRNRTLQRLADHYRLSIDVAPSPCRELNESRGNTPPRAPEATSLERNALGNYWADLTRVSMDVYRQTICVSESMLSAVQLMVALRAFEAEHDRMPQHLDALVPEYFETLPRDHFGGEPLRYTAEQHLLYSVGSDFTDAGGRWQPGQPCRAELSFPIPFASANHPARPPAGLTCAAPRS